MSRLIWLRNWIRRPIYFKYALAFVILNIVGRTYRIAVYHNGLTDFIGIADYFPNVLACPAMVFLNLGFASPMSQNEGLWKTGSCLIVLIAYEFLQPLLGMVFDWRDLIATVVGGWITLVIYQATNKGSDSKQTNQEYRMHR